MILGDGGGDYTGNALGRERGVGDGFELGVSDRQHRQLVFEILE